jgi:hypothetical protein
LKERGSIDRTFFLVSPTKLPAQLASASLRLRDRESKVGHGDVKSGFLASLLASRIELVAKARHIFITRFEAIKSQF